MPKLLCGQVIFQVSVHVICRRSPEDEVIPQVEKLLFNIGRLDKNCRGRRRTAPRFRRSERDKQ